MAIAACNSDKGVYFVITSPQKLEKVELFFGDQAYTGCSSGSCTVAPERGSGSAATYSADAYTESLSTSSWTTLDGTRLTFRVDPGDDAHTASAVLIVGYGEDGPVADKVIYDVPLKSSELEIDVTLDPADTLTGDATKERLAVWRRPSDGDGSLSACALVRHADPARDNDYFGPTDDPDCDGALPKSAPEECANDDLIWCGVAPRGLSESTCLASTDSSSCRLAGPPCVDGEGSNTPSPVCPPAPSTQTCIPTNGGGAVACTDQDFCHASSTGTPCSALDRSCIGNTISNGGISKVTCPFVASSQYCTVTLTPMGLGVQSIIGASKTCKNVQIAAIASPFRPGTTVMDPAGTFMLASTGTCTGTLSFTSTGGAGVVPPPIFVVFTVTDPSMNFMTQLIVVPLVGGSASNGMCPATTNAPCTSDTPNPIVCP